MDYKLGVRIQTGGNRQHWVDVLEVMLFKSSRSFGCSFGIITFDKLWENARSCLLSARKGETHLLILQDDILPCKDFIPAVFKIIETNPDNIITLFSNHPSIDLAYQSGIRYLEMSHFFMAQAYIIPVSIAKKAVKWIDENVRESVKLDDDRLATYCFYTNKKVLATAPSLVEHLGWDTTTLRTYKEKDFKRNLRMARQFIGFDRFATDFDWSRKKAIKVNDGSISMFISNLKKNNYARQDD